MIKAVTVFTNGDSRALKTWSNVPYFFSETLISKGIKVHRVDLSESARLSRFFNKTAMRLVRKLAPSTSYCYFRSFVHFLDARRRIERALKKYVDSEANIFLTFSFSSANLTTNPTILFCDWTYDYYLKHFLGKGSDFFERFSIKREDTQIEGADLVIALYPDVSRYMEHRYRNGNICYLGNVINSIATPDKYNIMQEKATSRDILFIGSNKYMEGARSLIAAYKKLKYNYPDLLLNIVGMQNKHFVDLPYGVKCYGYLDKADTDQREMYYALLRKAKVFVNTTPKWGAFSAMLEAMHFYVPVVITPYSECVATFGNDIGFGCYCGDQSVETLYSKLKFIFESNTYDALCASAHQAVEGFSWDNYIDKVLKRIQECLLQKSLQ